ncbi:hypothetical protein [Sinorhizobium sp. A49]|uniref:hypothetical protein n=1 Tax=Sinorhizobium sp. A49 TaxID=1945861 RepID=UPI001115800D|nr:hypothetical protein [Sinorhizobium sp. A49]
MLIDTLTESSDGSSKLSVRVLDLDEFVADHVSAGQLAAIRKVTPLEILANLTTLDVQPAVEVRFKADWFFKKSDIAALEIH